jgi:hypothetical protein
MYKRLRADIGGGRAYDVLSPRLRSLACAILPIVVLFFIGPARASALIVSEPTIVGPAEAVHRVSHGGFDGGYDWVSAQGFGEPEVNAAVWEASSLEPGVYAVEAWIPNEFGTADARYKITHDGITNEVIVGQYEVISGEWVTLGAYEFDGEGSVRSSDSAGDPGDRIDWSDMRWTRIASLPQRIETSAATTTISEPVVSGSEEFYARYAGVGYRGSLLVGEAQGSGGATIDTATWSTSLPAGEYAVEVFIPGARREAEVVYTIHATDGDLPVQIDQPSYKEVWVKLGQFKFGGTAEVSSSDATGSAGQDIAWSALRFVREASETVAPPPGQSGGSAPMGQPNAGLPAAFEPSGVLPLVEFPKKLLSFNHIRVKAPRGHRPNPYNLYEVSKLAPGLTLRYRCAPCLIVRSPFKLVGHSEVPVTRRSYQEGFVQKLHQDESELYAGSVLEVEVEEPKYAPVLVVYRLHAREKVDRSHSCRAAPGPIGKCLP